MVTYHWVYRLNGGLSQLQSADDAAIDWLTNYHGSLSHMQEEEPEG